ncbi:Neopullulanase [Labilithrix luteola]|uniref:Neopullulanase n=1 Tax=Labilithrix luteola TaxID=1391654 RepID=A0A0K1PUF7_9BACT|nr:alpha-amylase family glycosyl hydrolase [Labilithrix luteola]AKU97170.1 Neopullulanase [Labilithrix luteola]
MSRSALLVGGLAVATALVGAQACSDDPVANPPARACGLVVWRKAASEAAHVEIVGDWDGWKRPGVTPELDADGFRVASFEPSPGEHAYAIVEDGVWLTDENQPLTTTYEGHEVSLASVPDCSVPLVRVDDVSATSSGDVAIRATFLAAGARPLDPASIRAQTADGVALAVRSSDPSHGSLVLEGKGLSRGKWVFAIDARDDRGASAEEAVATVWVEGATWDPRDAIVYQVVLDRFRNERGSLATPATPASRAGGNLAGFRQAIESGELDALGVNTVWLSPLYANPSGEFLGVDGRSYTSYHGYWPISSRSLDARMTTEGELDDFMRFAHGRGLRVLFDVVPNHVHQQHPWTSTHPDWFPQDCVCGQGSCDWGTHAQTCWFAPYLPDLDWTNLEAARAQTAEVRWWFDRFGADGLRIDAVPMMPRSGTRRIVKAVRDRYRHPGNEPYILGENFTGPGNYEVLRYDLGPFGLGGSFDFPFMWTLRSVLATEQGSMSDVEASYRAGETAWAGSGALMGRMIGNHDVARFASVSAGNEGGDTWAPAPQPLDPVVYAKQRVALATVLTIPGAPVLYYGDEVGLAGKSDPDCRRVMPAESDLIDAQIATRDLVRKVGRARSCSRALRRGTLRTIVADAERFVFARELAADPKTGSPSDVAIVALSRRPSLPVSVPVPNASELVDVVTGARVTPSGQAITIDADAFGVHVFVPPESACP